LERAAFDEVHSERTEVFATHDAKVGSRHDAKPGGELLSQREQEGFELPGFTGLPG